MKMKINSDKSFVIRFGARAKNTCAPLSCDGCPVKFASKVPYLGAVLEASRKLRYDVSHVSLSFYRAFNKIMCKSSRARSELVATFLLQSICLPILTYGFECPCVPISALRKLDNLINQAIWRIFHISDPVNITYVRSLLGLTNLVDLSKARSLHFLLKFADKDMSFAGSIFKMVVWNDDRMSSVMHGCSSNNSPTSLARAIRDLSLCK
jgi:hypothetical protein